MEDHIHQQHHAAHSGHGHGHDYAAANRTHFDDIAHQFDEYPGALELAQKQVAVIKETCEVHFDEEKTTVLDFACGTGLISQGLVPVVKGIVGVDNSIGMVEHYNARAVKLGLTQEKMHALHLELKGTEGELGGRKFDVVVCTNAYHHFSAIEDVTRTLTSFLKPGGSLLVMDFIKTSHVHNLLSAPSHAGIVAHKEGFDEEIMRNTFEAAGLTAFKFEHACTSAVHGKDMDIFLAQGIRQATV